MSLTFQTYFALRCLFGCVWFGVTLEAGVPPCRPQSPQIRCDGCNRDQARQPTVEHPSVPTQTWINGTGLIRSYLNRIIVRARYRALFSCPLCLIQGA